MKSYSLKTQLPIAHIVIQIEFEALLKIYHGVYLNGNPILVSSRYCFTIRLRTYRCKCGSDNRKYIYVYICTWTLQCSMFACGAIPI